MKNLYQNNPMTMTDVANKFVKWAKHKWGKKLFFFLLAFMAFKTYLKNYGWLRKKTLRNKHVYITGGGAGIGRLMCLILAK